jgi:hypothetical protein
MRSSSYVIHLKRRNSRLDLTLSSKGIKVIDSISSLREDLLLKRKKVLHKLAKSSNTRKEITSDRLLW